MFGLQLIPRSLHSLSENDNHACSRKVVVVKNEN